MERHRYQAWTYLDLVIDGENRMPRYPCSELWAQRSQGTLLYVHIRQVGFYIDKTDADSSDDDMSSREGSADASRVSDAALSALLLLLAPRVIDPHSPADCSLPVAATFGIFAK
jgi:hypothetical protein